jgi:DnaK suppressor protein
MMIDKKILKKKIELAIEDAQRLITELEKEIKPIGPENAIGRISRMDAINNKSVSEATLQNLRIKLTSLEKALAKVGNQGFGICVRCGQPIAEGRLMLMPESSRCVNCA